MFANNRPVFKRYLGDSVDGLLRPGFNRTFAQIVVSLLFAIMALSSTVLLFLICYQAARGLEGSLSTFAQGFVKVLTSSGSPGGSAAVHGLAQTLSVLIAVIPAMVSVVCFKVDTAKARPRVTRSPNALGQAVAVALAVGAVASIVDIVLLGVSFDLVDEIVRVSAVTSLLGPVLVAILSVQIIYLLKLLGIENAGVQHA
jgi:hypothetical protein